MGRARGGRGQVVEHEVAVGDRVDGVLGHAGEAELGGDGAAVGVEVDPGQRAGSERQLGGRRDHRGEAAARRGRASTRRRAGGGSGRSAGRAAGGCSRASASPGGARPRRPGCPPGAPPARERRRRGRGRTSPCRWRPDRCASARCADGRPPAPAISVTRRSIAMWMSSSPSANGKLPSPSSRRTCSSALSSASRSLSLMIPWAASIRAWAHGLIDVIGTEAPVERDRVVEAPKRGVLGLGEAGHAAIMGQRAHGDRPPPAGSQRPSTDLSAETTCAICPSLNPGKNGSASERAATSSQTGNSPGRCPNRSR